ncbi:hypothetical protein ABIC09_003426 [Bradyrhizobium sp. S3.12.5]|uniref:DUF3987 domain-containing protein n=1 Tax=Bradyrhizobium sp. S3.12.5 TaxID=3156386 RepID=UPI003390D082
MTDTQAKLDGEFTGLPNPVDVEAAFQAATGADAAQAWLAERGVNYTDAKMIAIDDEAPSDTCVFIDAEPDWIALPVYQAGAFADLCLIHRNNPSAFHTVCGRAHWLGADNASRAKIVIHENPVEWLRAGCGGVVSLAGFGYMQHFKDLANACTIECSTIDRANDIWEWTFGGDQKALKRIQINGNPDAIRDELAWQAADTAKRRVKDVLDVPAGADLHKLYQQLDAVFLPPDNPAPANDNAGPVDLWQHRAHPPLPANLLPPVIEEFARAQGELMGVDAGGLAAAALAVCAAAIPDSIKLRVKRHDPHWLESARLWVAPIGDPSTKKSPLISAAAAPLKRLDRDMFRTYEEARRKHDSQSPADKKDTPAPKHVRLRLEDTTIEAAQEVLKDSPDGVLCLQDELSGWFGSMDKYSSGRGAAKDRGFWLQAFNGGPYTINRIGRGAVLIENLSVSLLGGIQPEPIRALAAEAHDDGLLQRLFPIVLGAAGAGVDKPVPDAAAAYDALVARLTRLRKPTGDGSLSSYIETPLRFDDAAQGLRSALAQKYFEMQCGWESVNKKLASHLGKYDGLFARLCIVFHCIESEGDRPASVITEDTAKRAATFLEEFLFPHAVAFYVDVLGMADRNDYVLATAGFILAHKLNVISVREVRRGDRIMRNMSIDEARAVLEQLDAFGWLEPVPSVRHDSTTWQVLPSVHRLFADRAEAEKSRREEVRKIISGSLPG